MQPYNILLVDDDPISLLLVRKDLELCGYRVQTATNGTLAIQMLDSLHIDLVITDLVMTPIGGIDVLKKAKETRPETKVIILTGYGDMASAIEALRLNADDFILKSCETEELIFRVGRCIENLELQKKIRLAEEELQKAYDELEVRVKQRTAALSRANEKLQTEIIERKRIEDALRYSNEQIIKEHNQRKALSKRLIDLLETDRQNVARELHDQVGQTLTSIKIGLEMIGNSLDDSQKPLKEKIKVFEDRAIQAIKDLKNISCGLRPVMLDSLGLIPSLRSLFDDVLHQSGIDVQFFSNGIPKRIDPKRSLALYRITQESLNNIVKHAKASKAYVNLLQKEQTILLTIEDDGVGFELNKVMDNQKKYKPLGLVIMRERTKQLGGEFNIESREDGGTLVMAEIPLNL